MNEILMVVYGFLGGAVCGSIFGVLWGRKHPSIIEKTIADAKKL